MNRLNKHYSKSKLDRPREVNINEFNKSLNRYMREKCEMYQKSISNSSPKDLSP